jgi:hypothetical protein
MKKGLLGLVVAALTVVGCQNYDDQFDDLNKKIAALSTEVTSLSSVQTAVTALGTKLDNLAGSALTDSDLAGILDEVAAVKAAVDAIDNSAVEAEVADLNAEVDEILEKLGELLSANAVIPGDLVIANLGDLAAAQELIGTEADDPLVTIQGNVHINITAANGLQDSIAAVNAIANKLKIVQTTVTVTTDDSAVTLNELMYVNGDYSVSGDGTVAAPKLRTVNGAATLATTGALSYPLLSSAASVALSETAGTTTITSVDLSGLASGAITTAAGAITLPNATSVKVGGVLPASVTLAKAVEFVSSYSGAAQTATHITVGGAAATFSLGATKFTGQVTITTTGAIDLSGVTQAVALNVVATDIDLSGMTKFTGATTLSATTVNIGAMVSSTDTVTLVGPTAVSLPALTTLGGDFVAGSAASFSAPKLATSTGTIDVKAAATVELLSLTAATDLLDAATITALTLKGQKVTVDLTSFVHAVTLDYTGAHPSSITPGSHVASNNLTITSALASLTTLNIGDGGIGTLTVTNSTLETLATNGHIINTVVHNNAALESFDFGHRHADGDDATTIDITGNTDAALTSIDLSSLAKVKHVNITGNTSLTTIVAPSIDPLAEPLATVTVTISGNDTSGTYTAAEAATETTPYVPATASAAVVTAFKPFIEAYLAQTRTATVVWDIDVDNIDDDADGAYDDGTLSAAFAADTAAIAGPDAVAGGADAQVDATGGVDTEAELSLF